MTDSATPALPAASDIAQQAAQFPFLATTGRLLLTVTLSVFVSLGWLAGSTWFGAVFMLLWLGHHARWAYDATVYGFRKGARVKTKAKG